MVNILIGIKKKFLRKNKVKGEKKMVNVYENGELIAVVKYNSNLDVWNGSNYQNGGTGMHLGITKLEDGTYVLIHGSDWQGDTDWAEIISDKKAYELIMKYSPDMLEWEAFEDLKKFKEELLQEVELQ